MTVEIMKWLFTLNAALPLPVSSARDGSAPYIQHELRDQELHDNHRALDKKRRDIWTHFRYNDTEGKKHCITLLEGRQCGHKIAGKIPQTGSDLTTKKRR